MKNAKGSKPDPRQISPIAVICAKSLARDSNVPYAREIWKELGRYDTAVIREGNLRLINFLRRLLFLYPSVSGLKSILEGRHLAIDYALEAEGNPHVMELASGLSPRGLYFTRWDSGLVYIETELEGLLQIKREIVTGIRKAELLEGRAATPNYHLSPLNVVDRSQFMEAVKPYASSKKDRPLAIVHAGLFPYLDKEEQKKMRDNVAEALRTYSPNGMWITPDLVIDEKELKSNLLMRLLMKLIEIKTGRKFTFFESEEETEKFLAEGGFTKQTIPSAYLADRLSCVDILKLNREQVRQKARMFDIYKMRLCSPT
ncbi:hypothetical protein HYU13_00820 [Candidatus Woesearchaeota archaeon]|nr:hypothetical protein [Candidatus Woesearchaeota archaeon]